MPEKSLVYVWQLRLLEQLFDLRKFNVYTFVIYNIVRTTNGT